MKFYTLLLAGKHVCLKPPWLFVLLETTALTKNKRQFYPSEKASLPSQARNNEILFSSSSTFQDRSSLASTLPTSSRQRSGTEFDAQQGLKKTHSAQKKSDITRRER